MYISRQYSTVTNVVGGGGSEQHRRYNCIRIYIYCMFYYFCLSSSCRLHVASTSMISRYIKLLVLKTINYENLIHLESTSLKVHVYHIIELFIYAFKFQFIVKIEYMYVVHKIKSFRIYS